jgi:hypothetical protein
VWLSEVIGCRPKPCIIIENFCDALLGSPICVDAEQSVVYHLLMPIARMPGIKVDDRAIINAVERPEHACCSEGTVPKDLMGNVEEIWGIREGKRGHGYGSSQRGRVQ